MKITITKIFAVLMAAALCVSFAGCNKSEPEDGPDDGASDSQSASPEENGGNDGGTDEADGEGEGEENEGGDASSPEEEVSEPEEETSEPEEETTEPEETTAPEENAEGDGENTGNTETAIIVPEEGQNTGSGKGDAIAETAKSMLGYDFLFGGSSPEDGGFDNSGIIYYALRQNGISCPRPLGEIMEFGTKVGYDELKPGDPVFFKQGEEGSSYFGGVYVGGGQAVMSFSDGIPVKLVDITTSYYRSNFMWGVRAAD